jgi:hypothetical protein
MTYDAYVKKLTEIGWLDMVPANAQTEILSQLKKNLANKDDQAFAYLALSQCGFDAEDVEYVEVFADFAKVSQKRFKPLQLKVAVVPGEEELEDLKVSFRHGSKQYSCTVPETGWFNEAVVETINEALEDSNVEQRFIVLPAGDQLVGVVFVPPVVYDKAVRAKLIPKHEAMGPPD